ncbi:RNA 2',3'-cyclic phosphodiesterase [Deinococcus sonorensis]|uniref:RNA 2',3'-cyclic phosphodiesterase n=2 Tax=Deinococcus sonorensis TaxID=309891 RepID=A0AAU7UD78_9DEIO
MTAPKSERSRRSTSAGQARPAGEQRLRLFYALRLPQEVATQLAQAQTQLRGNWRRVAPEQLHLTLAYLPGIPLSQVDRLRELGREVADLSPPLQLRLRGTGYHPNTGNPRVWFVKVEGEGLSELGARLQTALTGQGITLEEPFRPHITLARKKGPAPRVPPLSFDVSWAAGQLTLIHSTLRKTGPIYDTVSRYQLRGTAAPLPPESAPPAAPEASHG